MEASKEVIPIIYWTKWFKEDYFEGYTIDNCGLPYTCKITHDRTKLKKSSVVIFHASDINHLNDLPEVKRKDRAWVYHTAEAPKDHYEVIDQMQYEMTYRRDSDFPWGYFDTSLISEMKKSLDINRYKRKRPVAWIVSNCKAKNYRHHYVKELSKYIDIDIYGHCMENQVFPANTTTNELIQQYHFYLSIENSNCKDYVTEKLYNAYVSGTIPIVDGPSDYLPYTPNTHSVIRLDDFNNPEELANYLKKVLADKELYESYFDYRKPGGITNQAFVSALEGYSNGPCELCKVAYERHINNPAYYYPGKKIFPDRTCIASKHYMFKYSLLYQFVASISLILTLFFIFFLYKHKHKIEHYKKLYTSNS